MQNHNLTFDQLPQTVQILSEQIQKLTAIIEAERPESKNENDLMTAKEGREILGNISEPTFWRYAKLGKIKTYKICGRVYVKRSELMEAVERGQTKK